MSGMYTSGLIGLTEENVGIDRRFYTNSTDTNPTRAVSYNNGRVDVYLNGVKLVGNHAGNSNHDYTMDNVTGTGTTITLATGVALVATDVLELVGYVSNSSNTVQTYNFNVTTNTTAFTASHTASSLVNVYLNGVLLDSSDYTLNGSDTVTLGSNAVNGDVVAIQVIGALDNSNFVPASGGTFSGNVAYTGNIQVDDIQEKTTDHGVEIEQVALKDGGGTFTDNVTHNGNFQTLSHSGTAYGYIGKGDQLVSPGANANDVGIRYQNNLYISEGVTKRLSVESGGNVTVNTGNLVIGTAGKGINFSNATDTATGETVTSSILDEYEEGTWTPSVVAEGNTRTMSLQSTNGRYTRIGNIVHLFLEIAWASDETTGPSGTGDYRIDGNPFTSENIDSQMFYTGALYSLRIGGGADFNVLAVGNNSNKIKIRKIFTNESVGGGAVGTGDAPGNSVYVTGTITFRVAG